MRSRSNTIALQYIQDKCTLSGGPDSKGDGTPMEHKNIQPAASGRQIYSKTNVRLIVGFVRPDDPAMQKFISLKLPC